jgi:ATP-dependent Clp protease ATP-binding subunit ClpA
MFERLAPPARQVMARAEQESDRLRHNYVGPEHVLAGLAADDGPAGRVLRERALDLAGVRAELDRLVARGVLLGPYATTPSCCAASE